MKIAILGCGNIGSAIATSIEGTGGIDVVALFDINPEKAKSLGDRLKSAPTVYTQVGDMLDDGAINLVLEAASQEAVSSYGTKILESGKNLMIMSVGAFANDNLLETMNRVAKKNSLKIYIPSGAVLGIDGLKSANSGDIYSVTLITRKNPKSLGIDVDKETVLYDGTARHGIKKYPKNVNVAATVSLAGIGLDKTKLKIIADPLVDRNIHEIHVKGDFGEFTSRIENVPSPKNPKTSQLAILSAIANLKGIEASMSIGN